MDTNGKLTIYIHCIAMQGLAIINTQRVIVTKHNITREEALAICKEHNKQAKRNDRDTDYSYQFTTRPEIFDAYTQQFIN